MSRLHIALISVAGLALVAVGFLSALRTDDPPAAPAMSPLREGAPATDAGNVLEGAVSAYTCGMHPHVVRQEPGTCPICGMTLVPVRNEARGPRREGNPASADAVQVSRSFLQNFAVRTAEVRQGPLTIAIRGVGVLEHDEAKVVSVNTKYEGWIETARVHNIGETVARGDVLFEVYSPWMVAAQQEYLAALQYVRRLRQGGAYEEAVGRAESLLAAARERLGNWDVADERIDALASAGVVPRTVEVPAPASGFIVAKTGDSLEGMRISPGMAVLKIADHSTLWAKADFDEEDLRHVREGSTVSVDVDAFPGRRWAVRVLFFRSAVNPETRALTAYVEVANPDLALRPMMDVTVSTEVMQAADATLTPVESVLHSGERALVIVARGGGSFEPREVTLGSVSGSMQQVTAGLYPGERVVVSSQFLIASESDLQAAITQLLSDGEPGESAIQPHRH